MKLFQRIGAAILALAMLAGCSAPEQIPDSSGSSSQTQNVDLASVTDPYLATAGLSSDTVVATAGDVEITAGLLLYWIANRADTLYSYYGIADLPWDSEVDGMTLAQSILKDSLDTALLYAVLPKKAAQEGLSLSESFQSNLEQSLAQAAESVGGEELMEHYLWQFPLTRQVYTLMCESEDYNSALIEARYGEGASGYPSDEQVLSFLEDDQQCYFFKHILFLVSEAAPDGSGDSSQTADNSQEQKQKAEDLLAQLRASSDPMALFDQLMNEYSEDGGLASNPTGYLGTAGENSFAGTKMVDVVEKACLSMEEGQISDVLENTQGYHGYHIVLRLPVEGNVDIETYRQTYITSQMNDLQQEWIDENEIVTNAEYDKIDPAAFYTALNELRQQVNDEFAALDAADASGSGSAGSSGASGSQG